jgi:hypothetical protein
MPEAAAAEDVYSAIEESCRLLNIPCQRDKIWPVLTAYQYTLAEDALIVFTTGTGSHAGELDYTLTLPAEVNPYALARSNEFTAETGHPVGALLSDIRDRCPIRGYAIDCEVNGGFNKTYSFFPTDDLPTVSTLAGISSMPGGLAENAGFLARYGLDDDVSMLSIDYERRSVNVYFGRLPAEAVEPESVLSMLRELGLREPTEQSLELIRKSFAIYPTFSWDSPKIDRICFAVITQDPTGLPARVLSGRIEPEVEEFAKRSPCADDGARTLVYGITLSAHEEYYKVGSYYHINAQTRKLLSAFDALKDFDAIKERV